MALTALICNNQAAIRYPIGAAMAAHGFEVIAEVEAGALAVRAATVFQPDVIVLDLASAGELGLRIIAVLKTVSPSSVVIVAAPMPSLFDAAYAAGADAVFAHEDLRGLKVALARRIVEARSVR